jgi:serine/threonine protein kinase
LGRHPRLVQFFGQFSDGDYTLLVMELAPMGSLDKRLEEFQETITPQHHLAMLQQVCAGMKALDEIKLIHRDLHGTPEHLSLWVQPCRCDRHFGQSL